MAISKGTAAVLIMLILGGASGAIAMIVHREHAKEDREGRVWVKDIGPCVRRSAHEAISLAGIETAKSVDGTPLMFEHACYDQAHALAQRSHAGASVVAALETYAQTSLDFEKAALDFQLWLGHGVKKLTSKGRKLAAAAATARDALLSAEAKLSVHLRQIYDDEIARFGSLTGQQRTALVVAEELESIANDAERSPPKQDDIADSAKKIHTLVAHDAILSSKLQNVAPWLDHVVETGVLPADANPDPAPLVFWEWGTPR